MSYFHFIWKSHRSFLLFSMIIISLFQFLILRLVTTINYSSIIMNLLEQLPEFVWAMFGEDFISMLTVEGAAAFGLNHPLVLVILSIGIFHQLTFDLFVKMLKIGCNLWLLFVFIMSLTMVISSFEKEGNKVGIRVAGMALAFYLLHYLSSLWDTIRFTKPFNIFTYITSRRTS
ncbi:hypothetical protein D1BOALGB6SA_10615 [Olavius sp. associated proteobacterium Delta 1]|nr:hypothetical protein D1BOALGB6SA_10615 [Olavius sp. associated proteobacterium Delta 1]